MDLGSKELEFDLKVRELSTGKEVYEFLKGLDEHHCRHYFLSTNEVDEEQMCELLQEYMHSSDKIPSTCLEHLMTLAMIYHQIKDESVLQLVDMQKNAILLLCERESEELSRWFKFYKSLYREYCELKDYPHANYELKEIPSDLESKANLTGILEGESVDDFKLLLNLNVDMEDMYQIEFPEALNEMFIARMDSLYPDPMGFEEEVINLPGYEQITPSFRNPKLNNADYFQLVKNEMYFIFKKDRDEEFLVKQNIGNHIGKLFGITTPNSELVNYEGKVCFLARDIRDEIGLTEPISYFIFKPTGEPTLQEVIKEYSEIIGNNAMKELYKVLLFDFLILNINRDARSHRVTTLNGVKTYKIAIENDFMSGNPGSLTYGLEIEGEGTYIKKLKDLMVEKGVIGVAHDFILEASFKMKKIEDIVLEHSLASKVQYVTNVSNQLKIMESEFNG